MVSSFEVIFVVAVVALASVIASALRVKDYFLSVLDADRAGCGFQSPPQRRLDLP